MAHMIDMSNNRANIAFRGQTPWHNLGFTMVPGQTIEEWTKQAGLDWNVESSPVHFPIGETYHPLKDRFVLYRNDTKAPLGLVSKQFKPVQPAEVMGFFRELCKINGFEMEVAGSLRGGARIWGLAKAGEGVAVLKKDVVKPYVLLCTGFDGTLATHARLTSIRVVCNNTLQLSMNTLGETSITVNHRNTFDASKCLLNLGLVKDEFKSFMDNMKHLSEVPATRDQVKEVLFACLPPPIKQSDGTRPRLEDSAAFERLMQLCLRPPTDVPGGALGKGTMWGVLNGITYFVDHERGHGANRLNSAWFGQGNGIKSKALEKVQELVYV